MTATDVAWSIENGPMYVFEDEGVVEGFSAPDPRDGSIWALFVDPRFEARGVGKALLEQAERRLIETGHKDAWLTTEPGTRAEQFYQRRGWIAAGTKGREVLFRKRLDGLRTNETGSGTLATTGADQ
ncbi:GNAT family N-acetyltransferase [Terrarubrum flagellatum]|uniref:GNAT family N-acetyltransferase n=1 Tax=Terrirubrum flagellatum TaxID=2895980 RepID=UPI00314522CA